MLSSNSILRQGRYRVSQLAASTGGQTIYEAYDNLTASTVLVCESPSSSTFGSSATHGHFEGFVAITDRFDENGQSYLVTESLQGSGPWQLRSGQRNSESTTEVISRIRSILESLSAARKQFAHIREFDVTPLHLRATKDAVVKMAFFESPAPGGSKASESPYRAIEAIWETLDLASQKAISHRYDESSLETLEAGPDGRTDMYAVGAVFYQTLTGQTPPSALERSIELLDSGRDLLERPEVYNSAIPASVSDFLMRLMSIKSEDRFPSLEAASNALPGTIVERTSNASGPQVAVEADDFDDLDLLEIPQTPSTTTRPTVFDAAPVAVIEPPVVTSFDLGEEVTEEHPEPFITEDLLAEVAEADVEPTISVETARDVPEPATYKAEPEATPAAVTTTPTSAYAFHEEELETKGKGSGKMIGIAAAGIIVIAGVVWGIISFASSEAKQSVQEPTAAALASQPASQPTVESAQPGQPEPVQSAYQPNADRPATENPQVKQRPQVAEVKPEKKPEPKPAATNAPKQKKMTVEDLINDN